MVIFNVIGLIALIALPAIIAIHLFRRRFRPRPVTGLFLYGPGVRTVAAGRTPQRILWHVSLLAELLAALALAWYLIDPHFSDRMFAHHVVMVVDSRWRMAADLPTGSVDQRVRTMIDNRLAQMSDEDRVTIISSGATPTIVSGPSSRPDVARRAIATWKPDRPWHTLETSITLAHSLADAQAQVVVYSDHLPEKPESNCEYVALGQSLVTSGIADVRWWNDGEGSRIVVRAVAFGGKVDRDITLSMGTNVIASKHLTLLDNQPVTVVFPIPKDAPPQLTVQLVGPDPLPHDDTVMVTQPPHHLIRTRLQVSPALDGPLKRALAIIPGILLITDDVAYAHIVITDGEFIPTSGTWSLQVHVDKAAAVLGPFLQHRGHALVRGLDFTGVLWSGGINANALDAREQSPLLMAGSTVLLSEERLGRDLMFHAYVDIKRSSIVDHPTWPSLLDNFIRMRRAALPGCAQTSILSTAVSRVIMPPDITSVTVTRANGQSTLLQADNDGVVLIPPSDHLGSMQVTLPEQKDPWFSLHVLPCDARMADLRNSQQTLHGVQEKSQSTVERARSMLAHLLPILLAALCAGFGWLAFTREEGRAP